MREYDIGDHVRIDIPDEIDPDHEHHGKHGTITNIISDDAGITTDDEGDSGIYRVETENCVLVDVRRQDLRPPLHGADPE